MHASSLGCTPPSPSPSCSSAYDVWTNIIGLFLDNSLHRAVYLQQDFHSLYQGDMSVAEYCGVLLLFLLCCWALLLLPSFHLSSPSAQGQPHGQLPVHRGTVTALAPPWPRPAVAALARELRA